MSIMWSSMTSMWAVAGTLVAIRLPHPRRWSVIMYDLYPADWQGVDEAARREADRRERRRRRVRRAPQQPAARTWEERR